MITGFPFINFRSIIKCRNEQYSILLLPTKVFAKAGLDNETSTMYYYQQRFRLDVLYSALVHIFKSSFSIGHLYRAGQSMNSLPSQILTVGRNNLQHFILRQCKIRTLRNPETASTSTEYEKLNIIYQRRKIRHSAK